jgi:hypothetical protein
MRNNDNQKQAYYFKYADYKGQSIFIENEKYVKCIKYELVRYTPNDKWIIFENGKPIYETHNTHAASVQFGVYDDRKISKKTSCVI